MSNYIPISEHVWVLSRHYSSSDSRPMIQTTFTLWSVRDVIIVSHCIEQRQVGKVRFQSSLIKVSLMLPISGPYCRSFLESYTVSLRSPSDTVKQCWYLGRCTVRSFLTNGIFTDVNAPFSFWMYIIVKFVSWHTHERRNEQNLCTNFRSRL